ncbi:MAG: nitroreductase/quinone reductase family protein [Phototrophicaceae bacterium]
MVLMSPFHQVASKEMMLITVTGRKSGQVYTLPVSYTQENDQTLYTLSQREHLWWHNLRNGALVTLCLRGKVVTAKGRVIEEPNEMFNVMVQWLQHHPNYAPMIGVKVEPDGEIARDALTEALDKYVIVETQLLTA